MYYTLGIKHSEQSVVCFLAKGHFTARLTYLVVLFFSYIRSNDILGLAIPEDPHLDTNTVCKTFPDMTARQYELCSRYPDVTASAIQVNEPTELSRFKIFIEFN